MPDKRQHETLNHAYAHGWILDHWVNNTAVITHDVFGFDLYVVDNGTVHTASEVEKAQARATSPAP
jgi:hypothetical protein